MTVLHLVWIRFLFCSGFFILLILTAIRKLFDGKNDLFAVLTIVVLVLLAIVYQRIPLNRRFLPLNIIAVGIFAGAAGNLIDRVIHHYVIDFFYFSLINFPIFNVADIYVTLSAVALIIAVLFITRKKIFFDFHWKTVR